MNRRSRKPSNFSSLDDEFPYPPVKVKKPPNTEVADKIKLAIRKYYRAKMRAVFFELGLVKGGALRADVFALAMNGYAVVVEVKSSVADFRTDKKMRRYRHFSNQTYVAMLESVYNKVKEDIPLGFGVFVVSEDYRIKKVLRARRRELDPEIVHNLAIRAAFRNQDVSNRKNR